jgi:hypothetical protein
VVDGYQDGVGYYDDRTLGSLARGKAMILGRARVPVSSPLPLILLVALILAVIPAWPYSSGWGYYPGGILAVALVLVILLLLLGYLVRRTGPGVRQLLFWYNLPEQCAKCCSQDCLIRVSTLITDLTPPAT